MGIGPLDLRRNVPILQHHVTDRVYADLHPVAAELVPNLARAEARLLLPHGENSSISFDARIFIRARDQRVRYLPGCRKRDLTSPVVEGEPCDAQHSARLGHAVLVGVLEGPGTLRRRVDAGDSFLDRLHLSIFSLWCSRVRSASSLMNSFTFATIGSAPSPSLCLPPRDRPARQTQLSPCCTGADLVG